MFDSILCATDFSKCADQALELAIAWAEREGASLEIVHVLDQTTRSASEHDLAQVGQLALRLEERLTKAQARVPSAHAETLHGAPAEQILSRAVHMERGLVVMGMERSGAIAHAVLSGRTPVMLVPLDLRRTKAGPRVIVAPTDPTDETQRAVTRTLELASVVGARVALVEGFAAPVSAGWESAAMSDVRGALASRASERHRQEAERLNVKVRVHVEDGSPVDMLSSVADETKADLIVVGPRGHGPLWTASGSGVVDRVVEDAHVPLLVLVGLT